MCDVWEDRYEWDNLCGCLFLVCVGVGVSDILGHSVYTAKQETRGSGVCCGSYILWVCVSCLYCTACVGVFVLFVGGCFCMLY